MGRGIDIRELSAQLIFRASLKDAGNMRVTTGTTNLRLVKYHTDGTLLSYDFDDNTFKTTALTTPTLAMTHQQANNNTVDTGLWTAVLSTLTGFTAGEIVTAIVENSNAVPPEQEREFQAGSGVLADLVDDTITASKYDETTAFPVASADSGSTQIARTGADGDTLETLSDQVDNQALESTVNAGFTAGAKDSTVAKEATVNAGFTAGAKDSTVAKEVTVNAVGTAVTDLKDFDPATETVDVGAVNGVAVTDIDDFKADVVAGITASEPIAVNVTQWEGADTIDSRTLTQLLKDLHVEADGDTTGSGTDVRTVKDRAGANYKTKSIAGSNKTVTYL